MEPSWTGPVFSGKRLQQAALSFPPCEDAEKRGFTRQNFLVHYSVHHRAMRSLFLTPSSRCKCLPLNWLLIHRKAFVQEGLEIWV
jgi:hypothetical protein